MAKTISGIAIFPRLSENDVFYWPQELRKFDGVTVPLRWNHIQTPEAIIGEATFRYDEEQRQVLYTATIDNPDVQKEVDKGVYKVSIGASVAEDDFICHKDGQCAEAPILNKPEELSIVATPGIPESSLNIIESANCVLECTNPVDINTSGKQISPELNLMTSKTSKKECGCSGTAEQECPEGQVWDGEKCIPAPQPAVVPAAPEAKSEIECPEGKMDDGNGNCVDKPAEEASTETTKDVTVNVNVPETKTESVDVKKVIAEARESFMTEIKNEWTPKSEVVTEGVVDPKWVSEEKDIDAKTIIDKVLNEGHARIVLNKEDWITQNTTKTVSEAVGTTGTIPGVKTASDIVIIPGQSTYKPVRQFGQFESIPTGQNTARFYKLDVADFGALNESTSTPFTATTHAFEAIDVTCSVRGWLQQVLKQNLEDWPESFMNILKETARLAAIKDEHTLIVDFLTSTSVDFNNDTAVLTPGWAAHISGADGTFVDTTVTEDAVGDFQKEGLEVARELLELQGHDPINEKIIAFISARAYRTLVSDPDISEFIQIGDPSTTKLGRLEQFLGIEIMVSNNLNVQNNAYRNIVAVSGKAWALASQRDMEIEMDKEINGQYVNIVANHRIGVNVLDETSYVIVSSFES